MSTESEDLTPYVEGEESNESNTLRVIGWFSIGVVVAALSIYLGYEARSRYKFGKRTPYDFYANSGEHAASEFGTGI
jgi:hypothetical protein